MAPSFELMGWLKQAGAQAPSAEVATTQPLQHTATAGTSSPAAQPSNAAPGAAAPSRIAAPHSQAAAALAAALCSGGVPEKKHPQPQGTPISPLQEVLKVDRNRPEATSTLVVSKIANVKSEISRRHGHAIAVDATYYSYGLKGGQIRILNRHTGARTLLKDHVAPLSDLRFFRHDAERCLLASVDTAGQVHVRKVYEEDTGGEDTVRDEILARHELPIAISGPAAHPPARLAWHPTYDFVLAVAAGPTIYFINVPPTADVAAAPEYAAPVAAARSADGVTFTSVAFSPSGDLVAAADALGYVCVWALTPDQLDPALIQPLASEPDIRFQAYGNAPGEMPYGEGDLELAAVASLNWLPARGSEAAAEGGCDGSGAAGAPLVLLTGDGANAHLKLWSIDLSSKPQCTHALQLVSGGGASFFNHLELQPLYDCVVLANELRNLVYVLHVSAAPQQPDATGPSFDYASEFSVKTPILSCTLVPEAFVDESMDAEAFHLFTIQSDAVQQYTLVPEQCFPLEPPPALPAPAGAPAAAGAAFPGAAAAGAPGVLAGGAVAGSAHHHHHHLPAADAAAAGRTGSRDPLAALLALQQQHMQQQQQQQQQHVPQEAAAPAVVSAPQPSSTLLPPSAGLVTAPSDESDATSPLRQAPPAVPAAAAAPATDAAAAPAQPAEDAEVSQELEATLEQTAEVEVEAEVSEALVEAVVAQVQEAAVEEAEAEQQAPAPPMPPPPPAALLLTPSQLMQSAAAAAAARSAVQAAGGAGPSVAAVTAAAAGSGTSNGGAATEDAYSVVATAGGDLDMSSLAGSSLTHSLVAHSAASPTASEANMAAAVAAAEAAAEAEATAESAESAADDAAAVAAVAALPAAASQLLAAQSSPASMPPQPSASLVRRISQVQGKGSGGLPSPDDRRPQSAPSPLSAAPPAPAGSPPPLPAAPAAAEGTAAGTAGEVTAVPAAPPAAMDAVPSAPPLPPPTAPPAVVDLQSQQQLGQLLALQQQLLEQVSSGHQELLKAVRAEALRNTKAAADAAAARAAEAVARRASEERRKEAVEMQKALTAVITHASKDISQRVADAAAATTAAVKAAIGPAVAAAIAEALPAALSAGATAAALERALGAQLGAALPRAVADGLGSAFTAQVVPPLERATSMMFGQMETALRAGLDSHLAPLEPLAGLAPQLRDSAAQLSAAAKTLKSEAAAAQQAAAAAARAATTAAAAAGPATPAQPAAAPGAKGGGKGAAAAGAGSAAAKSGATADAVAAAPATAGKSAAAASRPQPTAAVPQPAAVAAPSAATAEPAAARPPAPSAAAAAAPVASAVPTSDAAAPHPASVDSAMQELVVGLLRSGDLDGAFSRVLERQDLALVLWACGAAGGAGLLAAEPCPLGQPTLLSLLTFLSYDLTAHVDLKLGWIDAILKRLDVREPGLAPHIRVVLDSVKGALAVIARGGSGATAAKAKQAVHQAIGLLAMLS